MIFIKVINVYPFFFKCGRERRPKKLYKNFQITFIKNCIFKTIIIKLNIMLLLAIINTFIVVNSYKFTLPYGINWIGQFENIDIIKDKEKCKLAFNYIPILIFKNLELTNNQYYDFVSSFDKYYDKSKDIIHPFTRDILNPNIGICNNLKSPSINFNNVWHMDNVGKYELPNVVT